MYTGCPNCLARIEVVENVRFCRYCSGALSAEVLQQARMSDLAKERQGHITGIRTSVQLGLVAVICAVILDLTGNRSASLIAMLLLIPLGFNIRNDYRKKRKLEREETVTFLAPEIGVFCYA